MSREYGMNEFDTSMDDPETIVKRIYLDNSDDDLYGGQGSVGVEIDLEFQEGEIVGWTAVSLTMDGGESLIDDEDYTKNMAQFIYQAMQIDEDNYEKYLV